MITNLDWWSDFSGQKLSQGDYLRDCPVVRIPDSFDPAPNTEIDIIVEERNVIILTQSCDLANNKAPFVALCPVYTLKEMENTNSKFKVKNTWEQVRTGRMEGFHMLAGFNGPDDNTSSFIVDFRQIYSMPFGFLQKKATELGNRKRLNSPYLEHLAQSFARFFMRVGLPSSIKPFNQ